MAFTPVQKTVAGIAAALLLFTSSHLGAYKWGQLKERAANNAAIAALKSTADKNKKDADDAGLDAASIKGQLAEKEKQILKLKQEKAAAVAKLPKDTLTKSLPDAVVLSPDAVPAIRTSEEREATYKELNAVNDELVKQLEEALELCKQENLKRLAQINSLTAAEQARALEAQAYLNKLTKEVKSKEFYRTTAGVTAVLLVLKLLIH